MTDLRIGTSSWSAAGWVGPFYPPGTKAGDFLSYYATRFRTVEADVTYYRVPDEKLTSGWDRKTPEGFLLSAKFPRTVVHGGDAERPDPEKLLHWDTVGADTERFLGAMSRLGPKCGPLLLQFPYFNRQAFTAPEPFLSRLDEFLTRLPKTFRIAVEVRNRAWVSPPLLDILRRHRAALALVDLLYMPHPADLSAQMDVVTTDFLYTRLIGDRRAVEALTTTFDRTVVDQSDRLQRWAVLLATLIQRVPLALTFANNHYAGHGPTTALELTALVERAQRGELTAPTPAPPPSRPARRSAARKDRPATP